MKNKITDIVCTAFIMILFAVVVIMNIVQAERPTVSVSEKRELASLPLNLLRTVRFSRE